MAMSNLAVIFAQAFVVGLSGALMPGPLLTYNIQLSYKRGFWTGPQLVLGHALLEAALIIGLLCGLGSFIQLKATRITLGILGGLMLFWMGMDLIRSESRRGTSANVEAAATGDSGTVTNLPPIPAGVVISITNPYFLLWWAVLGLAMITQAYTVSWLGVAAFYCGHILSDFSWYSLISAVIVKGKRFISEKIYRWLLLICGLFLIALALWFVWDALNLLGFIHWIFERSRNLFEPIRRFV